MGFEKKILAGKRFALVLIGSYKLRVCFVDFLNTKVRILGYTEKRQDTSLFANGECINLPGLAIKISETISDLEKRLGLHIKDIICNYPFGQEYLSLSHTNHPRKDRDSPINEAELCKILTQAEKICLVKGANEIEKLYGLKNSELDIILSRVTKVHIDGKKTGKILEKTGAEIKIQLLNITIPRSQNKVLKDLLKYSDKKVLKIIPVEYAVGKLYPQSDVVIIDIGATQTSLSLKKDGIVNAITKFPVGIHQLLEIIAKNHSKTRAEILRDLSSSSYSLEKKYFTNIWGQAFGMSLAELLKGDICPRQFALTGGGGNNTFLRDEILYFPYHHYDISIPLEREIVGEDLSPILGNIQDLQLRDIETMTLGMYALIEETRQYLNAENNIIGISLEQALKKLGYEV